MKKTTKWMALSFLISLTVMAGVLIYTFDANTLESIRNIKPFYIVLAIVLHLSSYAVWGLRTSVLSKALGYRIGLTNAIQIVTSSTFLASITPSSIGGEPLRIHLLNNNNMPIGSATAVVLGERVLDAIIILLAAPFALYLFRDITADHNFDVIIIAGEVFLFFILGILLYAIWKPMHTRRAIQWIVKRCENAFGEKRKTFFCNLSEKIDTELEEFHDSIYYILSKGKIGLLKGIICTLFFWIVEFSMLPVILIGLNVEPLGLVVYAAQVLLMIVVIIPTTPGSSGVAELCATTLFSVFVPTYVLGIVVISWRAFTYYMNLLVGGFVSFKILRDTVLVNRMLK
ncbi:flippase-like domain-containing protein [Methanohalophilus sp.]|uniref:lysylphosphatidylglycerol synthase transmembrane domain-containing protein n=1 Tax=Methanohalophilus sp. TaxID=1966352 RepID=UPI00260A0C5D|nr:flippase-like domain-containing protein [Methanohalophilus sp.]MDK2891968.1 glycosyltransferase 2 family protein [Methanohalophilus sp.]